MRYCKRCLYPDTKPGIYFTPEGICSACLNYDEREKVDWAARAQEFGVERNGEYDCLIPVSGGKDSHYQTIKCLELGLRPLCVTATTDDLSNLGRYNIENLKKLGVDYIEVSVNPVVRRRINKIALEKVGDISWPEHVTIFTIPIRIAMQMRIPLIVWGENPQNEYGGPKGTGGFRQLDNKWLQEFGGLNGLRVSDLVDAGISERDLSLYRYPQGVEKAGLQSVFLGYYFPWDGLQNAAVASKYGFKSYSMTVEGSCVSYENLDNYQTGIHDFFKYLKFGFGRATDIASMHIRRGYMSRKEGAALVQLRDGAFPYTYLGKPLEDILRPIGMTYDEFLKVCGRFLNKDLFENDDVTALVKKVYA